MNFRTSQVRKGSLLPLMLGMFVATSCRNGEPKPVVIDKDDMCSFCRMAISEKRYAAEVIDNDGQAFKFDDITCMTSYANFDGRREKLAAYFVIDFNAPEWIKAEEAHYVKSLQFRTPMSGGIVAFKDQTEAEEAAARFQGTALTFDQLTRKEQ
ncbi:MAG TPA: nitrous oxide reductase accessory protein NosL [Blastocatellia bacterium]|nr:nitrous oxide reductase accessory protein NosL [Blastocatellia bacterium]